jgi:AcrR family transcriptional regulator
MLLARQSCTPGKIRRTVAVMSVQRSLGLRERKKADTRRALSDAALTLAFERGIDDVTREAIAGLAGVSLRTFNNYFTGKYEALAYRQTERLRRSIAALRKRPPDEPLWTSITEAMLEPLETELGGAAGDQAGVPSRAELVEIRKLLMRTEIRNAMSKDLFDEWVEAIAERSGTDPARDMYPRLVVAVLRAVGDAAMDTYAAAEPPVAVTTLLREGMAAVAAGLPVPATRTEGGNRA